MMVALKKAGDLKPVKLQENDGGCISQLVKNNEWADGNLSSSMILKGFQEAEGVAQ